jgi:hypothetical protein
LGLDLAPLDMRGEDAAMWLRACVWPSDRPRLLRLEHFRAAASRADGLITTRFLDAQGALLELLL